MSNIRLGYVGCGFMAQCVHLPNFLATAGCDVVAVAETRPELGQRVQSALQIPKYYRHHTELLADPEVDAIAVSAAFGVQGEIARDALAAGKHVFMEKPMALTLAQADAILDAAQAAERRLMVGYMKRYDAGNELAHAEIVRLRAAGELGRVTYVRNHGFGGNWLAGLDRSPIVTDEPVADGSWFGPDWLPPEYMQPYVHYLQQFTHNINLLRWFAGAVHSGDTQADKQAEAQTRAAQSGGLSGVAVRAVDLDDDGYTGIVVFELNGVRSVLETGRLAHYRWDEHTQVYFEHGWVHVWSPALLHRQAAAQVEIYRAGNEHIVSRPLPQLPYSWSYLREAQHFIDCLHSGAPFRSDGEDTRIDVWLCEEIYRQYLTQRGVL